jgi:hypothetical protein
MMRLLFVLIIFLIGFIEIIALSEKNADWELFDISVLWGVRLYYISVIGFFVFKVWKDWSKFIFDKSTEYFWRGQGFTSVIANHNLLRTARRLEDIYALQLLCGLGVRNRKFYELNLVTCDGKRQNIDARVSLAHTQKIAQELADFLEVPLWDRSDVFVKPKDKVAIFFKKCLEKYYRKSL